MDKKVRRGALGKGISSLLGDYSSDESMEEIKVDPPLPTSGRAVLRLAIADVVPNPEQPRKFFDEAKLQELADSIELDGVIQPIIVSKPDENGKHTIIAGERRWRASQKANLKTVPALIKSGANHDLLRLALIENIQRSDLNPIEEAEAYKSLIKDHGLTQEQCAEKVSKDRSTVTNALRLLALPRSIQDDIMEGRLSMGHGRALLSLEETAKIESARDIIIAEGLSVRQTEELVKNLKTPKLKDIEEAEKSEPKEAEIDPDIEYLADQVRGLLQTKVKLSSKEGKGKLEIFYYSQEELERILSTIGVKV